MKLRRLAAAVGIAGAAAAAAFTLGSARVFDGIFGEAERKTIDYRVRTAADTNRDSLDIALVLFDTLSVEQHPFLTPFPRGPLADLVQTASANGARVIGLDVFLDRRRPELEPLDPGGDERLRSAIEAAGNVVLVAPTVQVGGTRQVQMPDPYFAEVAAAVATADLPTPHETSRHASLLVSTESGTMPGFALALAALMRGIDLDSLVAASVRTGQLRFGSMPPAAVAADGSTNLDILFVGPPSRTSREGGAFLVYAAAAVQWVGAAAGFGSNDALASWFRGRAVLLGSGFHDSERFRTPYYDYTFADGELAGWTYGVEVHASALQNLLYGRHLRPLAAGWTLLLLFAVAGAAAGATFWRGAKGGAMVAGVVLGLTAWAALEAFARGNLALPVISPVLAAVLAYTGAVAYVSIVEGREKRLIRGAFSKYVPPGVVDDLVADPSRLKLGGEKRELSILFSDVAGFTSMSETLAPETLVSILNEYLDEMSDIVFEERGTLDKYIGDAIMALWGAPAPVAGHALHACRTAVRMQRRLTAMNEEWRQQGSDWPALHMRIGVNTGTPVVGNIGGQKRFDYTALGDAVNLAARLEPACKTYGVAIMIAEATRREAGDAVVVRELDMLAVYGKAEPVRVYELVALAEDTLDESSRELLKHYDDGLAAYRRRDFELAIRYFDAALQLRPGDGPSRLYRNRSEDYVLNPPPADWDFVERRQVK